MIRRPSSPVLSGRGAERWRASWRAMRGLARFNLRLIAARKVQAVTP